VKSARIWVVCPANCSIIERKDIPLMRAIVMVIVFFYELTNLIADRLYALLNPRIRLE
jgi:ABC-type dipeptide/oligopeptide/nickel transport system permease component